MFACARQKEMGRSKQQELEDDDDDDDEEEEKEHFTANPSSSHKVKVDKPNRGKRVNPHRSKHSETEQRRRIKINERLKVLRDLIPQNDQKRDRASFLLEVIEYIQFLQEKLQIYEQSYQGWNREPTKLIPWRSHDGPTENHTDPSQATQNGCVHENAGDAYPSLPKNIQNPIESDISTTTTIQKAHVPASATDSFPLNVQMQWDMFDPVVSSGMPTEHLQEHVSIADMPSHAQPREWLSKPNEGNCTVPDPDNILKEQEELTIESGSDSISSAYSQGILNTLTQRLRSSGVDLSQASVSVQIDVGRQANTGLAPSTSSSKGHGNQYASNSMFRNLLL